MTRSSPDIPNSYAEAADILSHSSYAVALTGAGISTPSGIPDFRSPTSGLWAHSDPMAVASLAGFRLKPELFFAWIRPLARTIRDAQPNPAHLALARMEEMGILRAVITQNIDVLHTRAGSKHVLEVHGHMREATCGACFRIWPTDIFLEQFIETGEVPHCPECGGVLKPNVILFGEQLPMKILREAEQAAHECDAMLVVGSSLEVAPAADLPREALARGARLVIINFEPTYVDGRADVVINDDAAVVLPRLLELLDKRQ